jgi:hypothetical protein
MFVLLRNMMNKKNFHQAKYKEISFHVRLFYYKKKHDAMNFVEVEYVIVNVVHLSKNYAYCLIDIYSGCEGENKNIK